jgi:hypothetical protein
MAESSVAADPMPRRRQHETETRRVAGPYDVYVIGQDPEPVAPSSTGEAIGDGLFNRAGPNDFGS